MPKKNSEDKEKLKEKLAYIGLNLDKVPKFLKEFTPFSFRTSKEYSETTYKVYRYIDVTQIQILLTDANRLTNLSEKYKKAMPIASYLDDKTEENIERFTIFLKLLNDTKLEEIEEIEKEQEKLKQQISYEVKYNNNYIWQIYYSDISNQYFMLVPINEANNSALFYVIKKQIEAKKMRKKETIFVPISHEEYSGNFLMKSQIADLENYLWYFTKQWPNIYEVYDEKGKFSIKIVGQTKVYANIQSDYVISLKTKEQALQIYQLIKALFILATGLPENYNFKTKINENGEIDFCFNSQAGTAVITYNTLIDFIQTEVNQKKILVELENRKIGKEQQELEKIKEIIEKQTEEYMSKQKQIAAFLECKKTFFGKVKYYFSNRKREPKPIFKENLEDKKELKEPKQQENEEALEVINKNSNYTIEDLIEVCTKLDGRSKVVKNLNADKKALELKKVNLERKIKNANIYLNEIDMHKKSIFEFWKFTNKDELPSLDEGEENKEQKEKIGKSFNYEEDIEDLGKQVDELQRRKLSKNETDSIFAVKQVLSSFKIINQYEKNSQLEENETMLLDLELKRLKKEYKQNINTIEIKNFEIFGALNEDKTKIKTIHNQQHRENEKDKYQILEVNPNTELDFYIDNIRNDLNMVKEAFHKIQAPYDMYGYLLSNQKIELNNLEIFHLNEQKAIEDTKGKKEIYLYRLNIKENMPVLYYSNIIFYDNQNRTLPVGMDLSDEVLIDLKQYEIKESNQQTFNFNYLINEYENKIIHVNVIELDVSTQA